MLLLSAWTFASSVDHSLIDATIRRHYAQIRYCYEKRLPQHPTMEGTLTIRFQLEIDGTIAWAEVKNSTLEAPEVGVCVQEAFLSWIWPSGYSVRIISYPFIFKRK